MSNKSESNGHVGPEMMPLSQIDLSAELINEIEAGRLPLNTQAFHIGMSGTSVIYIPASDVNDRDALVIRGVRAYPTWPEVFSSAAQILPEGALWAALFTPTANELIIKDIGGLIPGERFQEVAENLNQVADTLATVTFMQEGLVVPFDQLHLISSQRHALVYQTDEENEVLHIDVRIGDDVDGMNFNGV